MAGIKCIIQKRVSKTGNAIFFIKISDTKEYILDKFKEINDSHINIENTFYYLDYKQRLIGVKVNEILFGETEIAIPIYKENVEDNKGTATKKHEQSENNDMQKYYTAYKIKLGNRGDYYIERGMDRFFLNYFPLTQEINISINHKIEFTTKFISQRDGKNKEVIDTLKINGKPITFQKPNSRAPQALPQGGGGGNAGAGQDVATAPYNFIPLNEKIVTSEWKTQEVIPTFDKWHEGLYNGYIDYQIENLTDMFIGNETDETDKNIKNIFALDKEGKKPMVSGSSFRGLIKNIMAICAYSKLSQVEDKTLYWRNVVKENYNQYFLKATDYLAKAGYIQKDKNDNYIIFEAKEDSWKNSYYKINTNSPPPPIFDSRTNRTKYQIKDKKNTIKNYQEFNSDSADANSILDYDDVWYIQSNKSNHNHRGRQLKYALINNTNFSFSHFAGAIKGKLVITGNFTHKKHFHWIVNEMDSAKSFTIDNEIVNEYKNDINLDDRANLIKRLEDNGNKPIPCFYVEINSKLRFGHTPLFRIPYEKSISDHINQEKTDNLDITEALFGMIRKGNNASIFTSRLNFMDAELIEDKGRNNLIEPKIHGTPKPTAYRMYLMQKGNSDYNWNDNSSVRGFKLYHHNNVNVKEETGKWKEKSHPKKMASLKENCKFKGRIYFDNLSEIELGALLFVLQLKQGLALKIGASKAYGMGSIEISKIELHTIERQDRYKKIFSDNKSAFELSITKQDFNSFISVFEKYILSGIKVSKNSLWETDRLTELEKILTFSNKDKPNWNEKIKYMRVDDRNGWNKNLDTITNLLRPI